jgi:hypothetical protein
MSDDPQAPAPKQKRDAAKEWLAYKRELSWGDTAYEPIFEKILEAGFKLPHDDEWKRRDETR